MAVHGTRLVRSGLLVATTFVVSTALAPLGVAAQDGPETPALGLLGSIAEKRFDDLGQYFCPELADEATGFDIGASMAAELPAGIDPQLAVDALTISVTGPSGSGEPLLYVLAEDAAVTSLGVEATITASLDPAGSEPLVRAIVEAEMQGQAIELTDENVTAFMALVDTMLGDEVSFSEYIGEVAEVTQTEDGAWLICGGSIVSSSPESTLPPEPVASASPVAASASADAIPFIEYVAALEAFTQDDPFAGLGDPPTKEEILAGFGMLIANATAEQGRLVAVVPEECYAAAHAELLAYWQSSIDATSEAAAQLEAASLEELPAIAGALDETLRTRHPIAYVEASDGSGGFEGSPFNILEALAACDAPS